MMIKGIDCAVPLTVEKAKAMAAAGMKFVCRYLVPASMEWKRLTKAEAKAIAALKEAKLIAQPVGTAIYFAVDFDAQPKDYATIEAYLRAAAKELPGYAVGVYSSYSFVEDMAKRGVPTFLADLRME